MNSIDSDENLTWSSLTKMPIPEKIASIDLSEDGILKWNEKHSVSLLDVVGLQMDDCSAIILHAFPVQEATCFSRRERYRRDVMLDFQTHSKQQEWYGKIDSFLHPPGHRRVKRLLVIVNPAGGKGRAQRIWETDVKPVFALAGITVDLVLTTHRFHASEVAANLDQGSVDGIVVVSGDGLLNEVVNGLIGEDCVSPPHLSIPIGVIPAGSGNAVAKSLAEFAQDLHEPMSAAVHIARGYTHACDIMTLTQNERTFHAVLSTSWGIVSDVDVESEWMRFLGGLRFTVQAIVRMIFLRRYSGRLMWLPADADSADEELARKSKHNAYQAISSEDVQLSSKPPSDESLERAPLDEGWREIDARFEGIFIGNMPWTDEATCLTPKAEFSGGNVDILVFRNVSRLQLLTMFLKADTGAHINDPFVEYYKARAFRLDPGSAEARGSYMCADGELLASGPGCRGSSEEPFQYQPLSGTVHRALATLFCSSRVPGSTLGGPSPTNLV